MAARQREWRGCRGGVACDRSAPRACRWRTGRAPRRRARSSLGSVGRPGHSDASRWRSTALPRMLGVLAQGRAGSGTRRTQRSRGHARRPRCRRGSARGHLPAVQDHAGAALWSRMRRGASWTPGCSTWNARPTDGVRFAGGPRARAPAHGPNPGAIPAPVPAVERLLVGTTPRSSLGLVPQAGRQPHADGPASLRTDRYRLGTPAVTVTRRRESAGRVRVGRPILDAAAYGLSPGGQTSSRAGKAREREVRAGARSSTVVLPRCGRAGRGAGSERSVSRLAATCEVAPGPTATVGVIRTERRPVRPVRCSTWISDDHVAACGLARRQVSRRRLCWPLPRVLARAARASPYRVRRAVPRLLRQRCVRWARPALLVSCAC